MMIGDINYAKGIEKIWKEDSEFQTIALMSMIEEIRGVSDKDIIERDFNLFKGEGMFYVPNDDYLKEYFGASVVDFSTGLYSRNGEYCLYYKRLAMPLRRMDGYVIGLCGYSNGNDENQSDFVKYLYPPKRVWSKERYMYVTGEEFRKAIEEGYIFIVDGLFDQLRLRSLGYNAVSLCGTMLTEWHKIYLGFVKHKIVLSDNDDAGRKLVKECKRHLTDVIEFKQGEEWDIDDFLKDVNNEERFKATFNFSKKNNFMIDQLIL